MISLQPQFVLLIYAGLGLVLGFALERGRFCFVTAFRDTLFFRNPWLLNAILISIGVSAVATGLISFAVGTQPVLLGTGWCVLVGGLLFGFGAAVAGSCASGILFRIPEGYIANILELGGFSAGVIIWAEFFEVPLSGFYGAPVSIPHLLGLPPLAYALVSGVGFILLGLYLGRYVPQRRNGPQPAWNLDPRRAWDPRIAGLMIAGVQIVLFAVTPNSLLGVTAPFATFGAWVLLGLGVNMNKVPWLGGSYLGIYPLLVLTVAAFIGAGLGAGSGGDFRVRLPRKRRRLLQAVFGGIFAGVGAGIGLGCNIGNFYAGFGLRMDLASLLFAPGLIVGIYLGVRLASKL